MILLDKVKFAFDPLVHPETKDIFADPVARTFYLAWRQCHIVNQYFATEVMEIAKAIRERKPSTEIQLHDCIGNRDMKIGTNFRHKDVLAWCPAALPFITGQKQMTY